jgi:hypothetical protein
VDVHIVPFIIHTTDALENLQRAPIRYLTHPIQEDFRGIAQDPFAFK